MKFTKNYLRKTMEEISPLVGEISGLNCNLENYRVEFGWTLKSLANYDIEEGEDVFTIITPWEYPENFLKEVLGHELMHNAQAHNYPGLVERWENTPEKENSSLRKLLDGDATLIQKKLRKNYFSKSPKRKYGLVSILSKVLSGPDSFFPSNYHEWANKIESKFGNNREEINRLYTVSTEELTKIFEE